jgi:hypothetical protein
MLDHDESSVRPQGSKERGGGRDHGSQASSFHPNPIHHHSLEIALDLVVSHSHSWKERQGYLTLRAERIEMEIRKHPHRSWTRRQRTLVGGSGIPDVA